MAYVLDENNPPNPEWVSFQYLKQFAKRKGSNTQNADINKEATSWYNAIGRKKLQGLWTDLEIVGFNPSETLKPPPARRVYYETIHGFNTEPPPPPPPPDNPQAFAVGGLVRQLGSIKYYPRTYF
jgi:hypothetical protein